MSDFGQKRVPAEATAQGCTFQLEPADILFNAPVDFGLGA
jgi:hypothetical protein